LAIQEFPKKYFSFMVIENVRKMLLPYSPNEKLLFGYNLNVNESYMADAGPYPSGGAGNTLQHQTQIS
jgi:hypothetical protein